MRSDEPTPSASPTTDLFAAALSRLKRGGAGAGRAALAGTVLLSLPVATGCVEPPDLSSAEQADWAQFEGQRNTEMVSFTGDAWTVCKFPNTRFGCGSVDVVVKLRVRPVQHADLAWKRVGVVYKTPYDGTEHTAIGNYVTTWGNGDEEWHVPMNVASGATVLFDAWYQDGTGQTWLDDNQGELHVANSGPSYNVIRVEPWLGTVVVGQDGVRGRISVQVSDLDFDKQVALVGTTDGWATSFELGIGAAGDVNQWYWVEDFPWSPGRERWQIDLDLPDPATRFEYAVVYRHGVVNGARTYDFWDNNYGANYGVDEVVPGPE